MSMNNSLLPKEAVALVQHIELNKAGWWDKAVHRLVLACVWLAPEPPSTDAIQSALLSTFKLTLGIPKLAAALASLESRQMLLRLPNDTYRIPEAQCAIFEQEIAAAEKTGNEAKGFFCKLVVDISKELDSEKVWVGFEQEFLGPLIEQVGANAYRLVAGEKMSVDKALVDHFLKPFPVNFHSELRTLVTTFLDPKKPEIRAHISRMLHARFCVEASGLPEDVLAKLNSSVGKQIRFLMFVDTNFLFSLLDLHENPSNAAAQELRELVAQMKGTPRIDLVITPETIDEAKSSIAYTKGQLNDLPSGRNVTQAALQARFSGMAVRFLTERLLRNGKLTVEDWFDPYLNDFVPIARSKGVELFNEKLDGYSMRQDVVDDINDVLKFEERLPENRRKSYQKLAHDMVLWHFVNDKRPIYVESPIDAIYWILTVDFRFIGFDEHKQKCKNSKVPLCIHPTSLIQLLQFWVPRTKEFEEAMLGSLRLPFLFQDLDVEDEKTSLKILKGIGRFDGNEWLSQDTITRVMLNDGLRSRLKTDQSAEAEVALIRDALVEEMRLREEEVASKAKALEEEVRKRDITIASLTDQKRIVETESAQTKKAKEDADEAARLALASQVEELREVKARLQLMEDTERRRVEGEQEDQATRKKKKLLTVYLAGLVGILAFAVFIGRQSIDLFPWCEKIFGSLPACGFVAVLTFVIGHFIFEFSICQRLGISELRSFLFVKRLNYFLCTLVIFGFFVSAGSSIYANWVQKNIDAETQSPSPAEMKAQELSVSK